MYERMQRIQLPSKYSDNKITGWSLRATLKPWTVWLCDRNMSTNQLGHSRLTGKCLNHPGSFREVMRDKSQVSLQSLNSNWGHLLLLRSSPPLPPLIPSPNPPTAFLPLCNWTLQPKAASLPGCSPPVQTNSLSSLCTDSRVEDTDEGGRDPVTASSPLDFILQNMQMNKLGRF